MNKGLRFWSFYTLPWLAFAASYVTVFIQQGSSLGSAISLIISGGLLREHSLALPDYEGRINAIS